MPTAAFNIPLPDALRPRPAAPLRTACRWMLVLIAAMIVGTGCATNGRQLLLKEYGPSIRPSDAVSLNGRTVRLIGFQSAPDLVALKLASPAEEPKPFEYRDRTSEQDRQWDAEQKVLRKNASKDNLQMIGNLRNGFGMVMSHVYALNDPAGWLDHSMKLDLEAQGARVLSPSDPGEADVSVSGTIQLCRTDMYMVVNGSLVVDLEIKPAKGPVRKKRIHTHGATAAMLASEGEYFHALRDARQKFSIIAIREIADVTR